MGVNQFLIEFQANDKYQLIVCHIWKPILINFENEKFTFYYFSAKSFHLHHPVLFRTTNYCTVHKLWGTLQWLQ